MLCRGQLLGAEVEEVKWHLYKQREGTHIMSRGIWHLLDTFNAGLDEMQLGPGSASL